MMSWLWTTSLIVISSQISPLTKEEEGSYECHASNSRGEASAAGAIHVVESIDDIIVKKGSIAIKNTTETSADAIQLVH